MTHALLHLERTIDASHVIPNHPGKCARLHGHTYRFQVWISGTVNPATGMIVDFYDVKSEIDTWDHRHLNDEVDFIPTAELLAAEMRRRILARIASGAAASSSTASSGPASTDAASSPIGILLRLWETPSSYAQVGWLTRSPDAPAGSDALHDAVVMA